MQSVIRRTSASFEKTMHSLKLSKKPMPTRREWLKSYEMIPEKNMISTSSTSIRIRGYDCFCADVYTNA